MHAVVYSAAFRNHLLEYPQKNEMSDWDTQVTFQALLKRCKFSYRIPLCNQTVPMTENRENWDMNPVFRFLSNSYVSLTGWDTKPEPGSSIIYFLSAIFSFSLLLLIGFMFAKGAGLVADFLSAGSSSRAGRRSGVRRT